MARVKYNRREADLFKTYVYDQHGDVWPWIKDKLTSCPAGLWPAIVSELVMVTNEAFYAEDVDAKKSNAALKSGNIYMREVSDDLLNMRDETLTRLEAIMQAGPPRKCSTCKHWRNNYAPKREDKVMQGCTAGNGSDGVTGICAEWESRV